MTRFALLLASLFALTSVHAQSPATVASCATAKPGAAWAAGTFLPCTAAAIYVAQPLAAAAIINDMRCPVPSGTCAFSWQTASSVLPTDQVWVKSTASPNGTWVEASTLALTGTITTTKTAANLSWTAPTQTASGAALPAGLALTYDIYRGANTTALTKLTNVSALAYVDPAGSAVPTTYYYAVSATCSTCTESAESAVVSITIAAPALQTGSPVLSVH